VKVVERSSKNRRSENLRNAMQRLREPGDGKRIRNASADFEGPLHVPVLQSQGKCAPTDIKQRKRGTRSMPQGESSSARGDQDASGGRTGEGDAGKPGLTA